MLLETLDLRNNDLLIYSQNLFNFNDSFKIIFKNEKQRRPNRISYFDVCSYVKDPSPKNLIIYRLLTNVNQLDAYSTKYGYFIKINNKVELIYFDPIFAIKDLRHLRFDLDPSRFRFKIQQVGLTSLTKKEDEPNFAEVYCFDLKAVEAQSQNDKIFADAIFAFDENYSDKEIPEQSEYEKEKPVQDSIISSDSKQELIPKGKNISEDDADVKTSFRSPTPPDISRIQDLREEIIVILKQALGIPEGSQDVLASFRKTTNVIDENPFQKEKDEIKKANAEVHNIFDLFKTTNKSDELSARERDSIILKFD
ncbi:MAG: hypothetical protein NTZ27_02065 [Ignavibacteriales bacterium]|nr:hypothetical protein [Ignavibacteriales bacterium]